MGLTMHLHIFSCGFAQFVTENVICYLVVVIRKFEVTLHSLQQACNDLQFFFFFSDRFEDH